MSPRTMIISRKYNFPIRKACVCAKSLQSWPTLCDPMDCSLPGSYVRGIPQGRIPEWTAMHFAWRIPRIEEPAGQRSHGIEKEPEATKVLWHARTPYSFHGNSDWDIFLG